MCLYMEYELSYDILYALIAFYDESNFTGFNTKISFT